MSDLEGVIMKFGEAGTSILPPPPGLCQVCAKDHPPEEPHNAQSLHYKYWFWAREVRKGREGRWPSWADAMEHCDDETKALWTEALTTQHGVDIYAEDA